MKRRKNKRVLLVSVLLICVVILVFAMNERNKGLYKEESSLQEKAHNKSERTLNPVMGLNAQAIGKNKVKISWNPVEGADGYIICRIIGSGKPKYILSTRGTFRIDVNASDTEYNFYFVYPYYTKNGERIICTNNAQYTYEKGNLLEAENVKAERIESNKVRLSWSKVKGADGYVVCKKDVNETFGLIAMIRETTYIDRNASETEYNFYKIYPYYKENGKIITGVVKKYVYAKTEYTRFVTIC